MTRKPIADAVRAAGGDFNRPGALKAFNDAMDVLGVPRDGMSPSPACYALIQRFEGYAKDLGDGRVQAYPDPATGGAPWTIGWGSTGSDIKPGTIWTREQAEQRFREHVNYFAAGVLGLLAGAATTQSQFDAMVSLAYNIGLGNFGSSTLLRKHRAGDHAGAAAQFAVWNKAAGKVMAGLVKRRAAEAALYRGLA